MFVTPILRSPHAEILQGHLLGSPRITPCWEPLRSPHVGVLQNQTMLGSPRIPLYRDQLRSPHAGILWDSGSDTRQLRRKDLSVGCCGSGVLLFALRPQEWLNLKWVSCHLQCQGQGCTQARLPTRKPGCVGPSLWAATTLLSWTGLSPGPSMTLLLPICSVPSHFICLNFQRVLGWEDQT